MAIKVAIERTSLPGQERQLLDVMRRIRKSCLEQPGYISGETLRDSENPRTFLVISVWFGLMDWRRWYASNERRELESEMRPMLSAPESIRVLVEGLSDLHSGA
ncbi:MAG: antibiotic biosynthesis monooxygenase family protein [Tepidiformaceae bacterium]